MTTKTTHPTNTAPPSGAPREAHQREVVKIKFNKHNVTDKVSKTKARVFYSLDNRVDGRRCVTMYAKDYGHTLGALFAGQYQNDTDTMTDYFDKGRVVLFEDHPLYSLARTAAENK